MTFRGGCHCGAIRVRFETRFSARTLPTRRCTCLFCTKHAARSATDAGGRVTYMARGLSGYDASRLICRRCGVYVGMIMRDGARLLATINVNALDGAFTGPTREVDYSAESAAATRARRRANWTPAVLRRRRPS